MSKLFKLFLILNIITCENSFASSFSLSLDSYYSSSLRGKTQDKESSSNGDVSFSVTAGYIFGINKNNVSAQIVYDLSFKKIEFIDFRNSNTIEDKIYSTTVYMKMFHDNPIFLTVGAGLASHSLSRDVSDKDFYFSFLFKGGIGFNLKYFEIINTFETHKIGSAGTLEFYNSSIVFTF